MAFSQVTNSETMEVMARIDHVVGLCSVVESASDTRSEGDSDVEESSVGSASIDGMACKLD
jgi:hypothetical protein